MATGAGSSAPRHSREERAESSPPISLTSPRLTSTTNSSAGSSTAGTPAWKDTDGCYPSTSHRSHINVTEDTNAPTRPIQEHKRLFGYGHGSFQPPKSQYYGGKGKGKCRRNRGRPMSTTWKKDCICLREMFRTRKPSAEERMQLAKLGLGLEEVCFDCDGDAEHIHTALLTKFPQLQLCGGYTLLRVSDSCPNELIEIEHPAKGMTVRYLKDILNQAKLYIRPLQSDILEPVETRKKVRDPVMYFQ